MTRIGLGTRHNYHEVLDIGTLYSVLRRVITYDFGELGKGRGSRIEYRKAVLCRKQRMLSECGE